MKAWEAGRVGIRVGKKEVAVRAWCSCFNMAGASSVAGEVFVDALPYFDQGYDAPGVREAVSTKHNIFRV